MRCGTAILLGVLAAGALASCGTQPLAPIETGFGFTNLSRTEYAALGVRASASAGADDGVYFFTELLAPGATTRIRFLDALGAACPGALDFQILTYRRIRDDVPIGLDEGEAVELFPLAAGEVTDIPACAVQPLETFTIVNWDAPEGTARVKFAQATPVEAAIRAAGIFPNVDAAWEVTGVAPKLATAPRPAHAASAPIAGHVVSAAGEAWAGIGVLLRTRFRVRTDDNNPSNDPDAGFGDPIAFAFTDDEGAFRFERPAGAYRVEVFADGFVFQPASVDVEVPQSTLVFIAEELP
ncbi:MAG TPA: carboxypeptidase-like regulatory domain-containing protein [Phycisphaerae bacterium]|nr:carboxypeptidase-like regulatory domain-containing protein [Phycisphaerae bacterium]